MEYGTGALLSPLDIRDYKFEPADRGGFDWSTGFDLEKKLGHKLTLKDQNGSGSCGGQAWSYYGEVLEEVATQTYEPRSARWIYSHTHVPTGGSNGRTNCAFVIKSGWAKEVYAPSYDNGKPPREEFMRVIPNLTGDAIADNQVSKALSYLGVKGNIEHVAQALEANFGCIIVVNGQDNGTWRGKFPKPPKEKEWGHFLFCVGAELIGGKKYIKVINSWGDDVGDKGYQWIGEDYFNSGHVREAWTLAWDYTPAKKIALLKATIDALQKLIALYQQLYTVRS